MDTETEISRTKLTGPFNEEISVYHSNGLIWGAISQWCRVLKAPYFMGEYLGKFAEVNSAAMKGGQYTTTVQGEKLYRWPAIAASLDSWHRTWMLKVAKGEHATMEQNKRLESERFALSMSKLKQWGYELQERELQAAMSAKMSPTQASTGLAEVNQAIQAIQSLAHVTRGALAKHGETLDEHDERLEDIENSDPARRDPAAFVTVKQRCIERALSLGFVVEGRMNLSQACGQFLQKSGAEKGPVSKERLDGSSIVVEVATWRRTNIDHAIEHFLPDFALPRKRKELD
ncbi:MAG: hypothetical protein C3F18_12365 [Nitrosomonadales bacterium]|nr:MAG: hypothetical protein C3F18_12365 [Nitrosomonadales bacterium]